MFYVQIFYSDRQRDRQREVSFLTDHLRYILKPHNYFWLAIQTISTSLAFYFYGSLIEEGNRKNKYFNRYNTADRNVAIIVEYDINFEYKMI